MSKEQTTKDVFSSVEAEALRRLKKPETRGAAKTVLEYIAKQRKQKKNA